MRAGAQLLFDRYKVSVLWEEEFFVSCTPLNFQKLRWAGVQFRVQHILTVGKAWVQLLTHRKTKTLGQ